MPSTIQLASGAKEADIIEALESLNDGGVLYLPKGEVIPISTGLAIDVANRDITLDLNGSTLVKAGSASVITGLGQHDAATPVKLGSDGNGNATLTYAQLPSNIVKGAWIKVVSDDALPRDLPDGALPSRLGQALEVLSVDGNKVTFKGSLASQEHYETNVRASSYQSGALIIRNGEIAGSEQAGPVNAPLVQLRSVVDAAVHDLSIRDGIGRGISIVDSVNAKITEVSVKNLADGGSAALGIAVSSLSSTGTTVKGLYAENVAHAADNNAIGVAANSAYIAQYGGDIGMSVSDSVAYGTRSFAWSWHSEAIAGKFENVMAFDSFGMLMARGVGGSMTDSGGAGNGRGVMFYEFGDGDATGIALDGVTLKETQHYGVFSAKNPQGNTITDSFFESKGPGNLAPAEHVAVTDTQFVKTPADPDDILQGTAGRDMLLGGKGEDRLAGEAGDDYLWGGAGSDSLTGGSGRDRFAFHSFGEAGDVIADFQAGAGGDVIDLSVIAARYGWASGDPIANGSVRFVQQGSGVEVQAADGSGRFVTLATLENLAASELGSSNIRRSLTTLETQQPSAETPLPQQVLQAIDSAEILTAIAGLGRLDGHGGGDTLFAHASGTHLDGGTGDDTLIGHHGRDILDGGSGRDVMRGGDGDDLYSVDSYYDEVFETAAGGYDTLLTSLSLTSPLTDHIEALTLTGGANLSGRGNALDNVLTGNAGANTLRGDGGADSLFGGAGNDNLYGDEGGDVLFGGEGNDRMLGGAGDDVLEGGLGADILSGSTGYDAASYAQSEIGAIADLGDARNNSGGAAGDIFSSIENLIGSAQQDSLYGNATSNVLDGGGGDDLLSGGDRSDRLMGGAGNDWLDGGAAKDILNGGAGADVFSFASLSEAGDTIQDFRSGEDRIALSGSGFGLDSIDGLVFLAGAGASASDARAALLHNTSSGQLLWDADGSGSGKALLLASLSATPQLSLNDFMLI